MEFIVLIRMNDFYNVWELVIRRHVLLGKSIVAFKFREFCEKGWKYRFKIRQGWKESNFELKDKSTSWDNGEKWQWTYRRPLGEWGDVSV